MKIRFEQETCSRCGGCGRYSYNQLTGDTCFKCNGSGQQFTRAGKAARREWDRLIAAACTVPTWLAQPGDKIRCNLGMSDPRRWHLIESATLDLLNQGRFIMFGFAGDHGHGFCTAGTVERHPGRERIREIMAAVAKRKGATLLVG
jgi:hypothetical protein